MYFWRIVLAIFPETVCCGLVGRRGTTLLRYSRIVVTGLRIPELRYVVHDNRGILFHFELCLSWA